MIESREGPANPGKKTSRFITIDDVVLSAGMLYNELKVLSKQRNPLDIRRGVRGMKIEHNNGEMIKGSGKTYFLDIQKTKTGKPYLKITETRKDKNSGDQIRNSIFIFQEDIRLFTEAITRISDQIGIDGDDK